MKRICTLVAAILFAAAAYGQGAGTVTNHAFAIGKGPNVTGYTSLLCGAGQLAIGQAAANPICRTVSGDATLDAAGVVTLATVNGNVGTFGSATQCITVTYDAKGRATAASAATCTPAVGSITGMGAGVAAWLATPSGANLATALTTPLPVTKGGTGGALGVRSFIGGNSVASTMAASSTAFIAYGLMTAVEIQAVTPVPIPGTFKNLSIVAGGGSPGVGNTWTATVRNTSVNTAVTCVIPNGSNVCTDTTHSVLFAANDRLAIQVVSTAGTPASTFTYGLEFDPTP